MPRALYGTEPFRFDAVVHEGADVEHGLNGRTTLCGLAATQTTSLSHPWTLTGPRSCEQCRRGYAVDVLGAPWVPGPAGTGKGPHARHGPLEPFPAIVQGKASRRSRLPGDLYALTLTSGWFLGARLAVTDAQVGGMTGMYVVYLYTGPAETLAELPARCVALNDLLMPPLLVNRSPWTSGYMTYVGSAERCPGEILDRHVFQDRHTNRYYDPHNREVPKPARSQPIGERVVTTTLGLAVTIEAHLRDST